MVIRLQKPWVIKKLVMGKALAEKEEQEDSRLEARLGAALKFLYIYEVLGVSLDRIEAVLDSLEAEACNQEGN